MQLYPESLRKLEVNMDRITFGNLKKIATLYPEESFKEFHVTGVKIIKDEAGNYQGVVEIFGTESPESEEMEAALAVRISASIPYFYKAVMYNNNLYIDGGCLDDFPIHIFDDPKYKPENIIKYRNNNGANLATLGLYVESKSNCENIIFNRRQFIEKQTGWKNDISSAIESHVTHTDKRSKLNQSLFYLYHKYSHTTIMLDDHNIDRADFGMPDKIRDEFIKDNREITRNWLDLYRSSELILEDNIYEFDGDMNNAIVKLCQNFSRSELTELMDQFKSYTPGLLVDKNGDSQSA